MKAAVAVWDGRISPVFDVSRNALILTIKDDAVVARSLANIATSSPELKLERLAELGVETLICGAISRPFSMMLQAGGIKIISGIAGAVEEVLQAFLHKKLSNTHYLMPGYEFTSSDQTDLELTAERQPPEKL